ncbi:MAG: hypothetical protein ACLQQ4_08360 [Bacteroidia bacterium]
MKNANANQEKVLDYIKANPGSTIEAITEGANVSNLLVRKAVKELQEAKRIESSQEDGGLSIINKEKAAPVETAPGAAKPNAQKAAAKPSKKNEDDDLGPKLPNGRDNSKFKFGEHRNLHKGRLVHLLIKTYIQQNPKVTLAKLQEVFHSEEIQPRFGIINELGAARKFSKNNVDRYFIKNAEDIIKLADGKKVAVCNQWTAEGIQKLLKVVAAHPIGFKVKVEAAE